MKLAALFLMIVMCHCKAALQYHNVGGAGFFITNSWPELNACTNDITVSYWGFKSVLTTGTGKWVSKGGVGGLFEIKSSSTVERQLDWGSANWGAGFGAQLWRTFAQFDVTNQWVHHLWTFTYMDTNSMRLYTNGVEMPGRWIQAPINKPGTNVTGGAAIGSTFPEGSALIGAIGEVAIWNKILTSEQRSLLVNSRVKGIVKQIEPGFLRAYFQIDAVPYQRNSPIDNAGAQLDRAYSKERGVQPAGGFTTGIGESWYSYPPNE